MNLSTYTCIWFIVTVPNCSPHFLSLLPTIHPQLSSQGVPHRCARSCHSSVRNSSVVLHLAQSISQIPSNIRSDPLSYSLSFFWPHLLLWSYSAYSEFPAIEVLCLLTLSLATWLDHPHLQVFAQIPSSK